MTTKQEWPITTATLKPAAKYNPLYTSGILEGACSMLQDVHHLSEDRAREYIIGLLPKDFKTESIPFDWLGLEEEMSRGFLEKITPFSALWDALPEEQTEANPDLYGDLIRRYLYVLASMFREHRRHEQADSRLFPFQLHGTQWIADWDVRDLSLKNDPTKVNWHLQNTSQWRYAGCLLVQNGKVSVHT